MTCDHKIVKYRYGCMCEAQIISPDNWAWFKKFNFQLAGVDQKPKEKIREPKSAVTQKNLQRRQI